MPYGLQRISEIAGSFFQVLLSTIFYKRSGTFNETLTLSSLAYIFSKNSWFLFLDKSQVQKNVDVITCFSCTVKKQKFKSIQAHSWTPHFPMLSFSKCLVCVFCLFTPFLSVLFVFYRKNLVLLHLMNRLHFLQVNNFLKGKTLWKIIF